MEGGAEGRKKGRRGGMTICLLVNPTWNARIAPLIFRRERKEKSKKNGKASFFLAHFSGKPSAGRSFISKAEANFRPLIMVRESNVSMVKKRGGRDCAN